MTKQNLREIVKEQNLRIHNLTDENLHLTSKVEMLQKRLETFDSISNMLIELRNQREALDFEVDRIAKGRKLGL